MKKFKVQLYDGMDRLVEEVDVTAKGKGTAYKLAKFKTQVGWDYYIIAIEITD